MASSRHPPAPPTGSSVGQSGQGKRPEAERIQVPGPPGTGSTSAPPLRRTNAYGPPALPPPLRPVGGGLGEDYVEEQTTVDPQGKQLRELLPDLLAEPHELDPDQKSTTMTEALTSDNAPDLL